MEPSRPIWRRRSERRYSGGGPASIDQHHPVRVYLGGAASIRSWRLGVSAHTGLQMRADKGLTSTRRRAPTTSEAQAARRARPTEDFGSNTYIAIAHNGTGSGVQVAQLTNTPELSFNDLISHHSIQT